MADGPANIPADCSQYALALQASQEGFWDWDLAGDRLWGSSRWQSITGIAETHTHPGAWMERVHPHDKPRFEADLQAIRSRRARTLRNEHRIRHNNGEWRWVIASAVAAEDEAGRVTHIAGSLVDNTERRTADALTGLQNRFSFADHLEQRMERARLRGRWDFAVMALALDRFDQMNEALGSAGGDRLLLETAQRIRSIVPEGSVAARLSGPEFLVCLESVHSEAEAVAIASRVTRAVREPFVWQGHQVALQPAIGIATAAAGCVHPGDLTRCAESALTHARREESRRITCYSRGMREAAMARLEMEADLERAIRDGGLVMFYQPEVDLRSRRIIGFEALVRWKHERLGLLPPSEFIPLAEETGLILSLGDWGLAEACRQLVRWRATGNPELMSARMSVNLSSRQFERPGLVHQVRQVLEETGLGPGSLRLEVTESSLMADGPSVLAAMRALSELGVGLHMDDFGVGYSSLHYLQRFPFDTLKIDRSFVLGMMRDPESRQIVRSILDLAHSFHLGVVAEGIEDRQQLEELVAMGCACGQGYYFSKPLHPAAIDEMLASDGWRNPAPAMTTP